MSNLILREFNGKSIRHRADGFMSLTDMCQASGRLLGNWTRLDTTKEYLKALQCKHYSDLNSGPIEVNEGGNHSSGLTGTWGDRRVAMRLAQWISADFALQVDEWVVELMSTGTVSITPPQSESLKLAPAIERIASLKDSLKFFGIDAENPRFKQGLQDLTLDVLGIGGVPSLPCDADVWCGVAERSEQLGIPVAMVVRYRSQLGKTIKSLIPESDRKEEDRLCNGTQRPINLYRVTEALDNAILGYFEKKAEAA